jgi:hypothetical protein
MYHFEITFTGVLTLVAEMLFAYSNGYCLSLSFYYAVSEVQQEYKGRASATLGYFLNLGIYSGTIMALVVMKNLI